MSSLIAAIALQQLRDMEQLQRDWGRRPSRKRRRAITLNSPVDHAVTDGPRDPAEVSGRKPIMARPLCQLVHDRLRISSR